MSSSEARRSTLIESLRMRFAEADRRGDAVAKQALFREAVYLDIQPEAFIGSDAVAADLHCSRSASCFLP
jgi:hypothetical protein